MHLNQRDSTEDFIRLPGSPFWNVFRRFGRDEAIALVISLIGTAVVSSFTSSIFLLALTGPIVEKSGFFVGHLWDALLYKMRKRESSFRRRVRRAFRGGSVSLLEDIFVHDPIYIGLFYALSFYPGVPVWLITFFSFFVAVIVVAWLEVFVTERRYGRFKKKMSRAGFGLESYYEARFFIPSGSDKDDILDQLRSGLGLTEFERLVYHDSYFKTRLPRFSGRSPKVRLRKRTMGIKGRKYLSEFEKMFETGFMQTLQVVYTRPQEVMGKKLEQFRFFPVRKHKLYWYIDEEEMPQSLEGLPEKIHRRVKAAKYQKEVSFSRIILLDDTEELYVALDWSSNEAEGYIVELKVRKDKKLLLDAMRFVMTEFPVQHTTQGKADLEIFE